MVSADNARGNQLLAALPDAESQRILPQLEAVDMPLGQVLYESGRQLSHVYFPTTAIVSLLAERFKYTSQVGVLKARAGFAPADYQREHAQIERLHRIADEAGLDPEIAEMYREFVVTEAKRRHKRIAENGGDPGVLDVFA